MCVSERDKMNVVISYAINRPFMRALEWLKKWNRKEMLMKDNAAIEKSGKE